MTFRPEELRIKGEMQVSLSNGHVVKAQVRMDELGTIAMHFTDPDMVARWLRMTLDNQLVGLSISTLHNEPTTHLPQPEQRPQGIDYLQERDGEVVWFHKCRVLGELVLPADAGTCEHCGVIQVTRRKL